MRGVTLGQSDDERVRTGGLGGRHDLVLAGVRACIGDVLRDGGGEQDGFLEHDGELVPQIGEPEVAQVHTVEKDRAAGRVIEAGHQADERGLARSGGPRDPERGSGIHGEGHAVENGRVARVGEADVAELEATRRPLERAGVRPLGHVGTFVEELEGPLGAGERGLQGAERAAHRLERAIELREVRHHQEQLAQRDPARLHTADADDQDRGCAQRRGQVDEAAEDTVGCGDAHLRVDTQAGTADEPQVLVLLAAEGLDHAQRGERLLDDTERRALQLLGVAVPAPGTHLVAARQDEQHWSDGEGHQREWHVDPGGHIEHRDEGDRAGDQGDDAVDGHALNRGGVVLDAVDGVGGSAHIVKRQREALRVTEQSRPEGQCEPLSRACPEHEGGRLLEQVQYHHREQQPGDEAEHRVVRSLEPVGRQRGQGARQGF